MTTINLPDETVNVLQELAAMWGMADLTDENDVMVAIISKLVRDKLDEFDQPEPDTIQSEIERYTHTALSKAISQVIDYNAGGEVTLSNEVYTDRVAVGLTFDVIKGLAYNKDAILARVDQEVEHKQLYIDAVVQLYNAIPLDMWGTQKAIELFNRQLTFLGTPSS
jgi:hypothetical protein